MSLLTWLQKKICPAGGGTPSPALGGRPSHIQTGSDRLDSAGLVWFNELKNSSQAWLPAFPAAVAPALPTPAQIAAGEIQKIIDKLPAELTQQDVFNLEDLLILVRPVEDYPPWINSLREDYLGVFGPDAYQKIILSLIPNVNSCKAPADLPGLQAEARRLQAELHWQSATQPWAHRQREHLMYGIVATLVGALVMLPLVWLIGVCWSGFVSLEFVLALFLLGALGGCISTIQRIQSAALATTQAMTSIRYNEKPWGVWLSPLQGAIFALILTLILLAGVASPGSVVPNVNLQGPASPAATNTSPLGVPQVGSEAPKNTPYYIPCLGMSLKFANGTDIAILLLLAFAAGFSERMVPDMLSELADKEKV